MKGPQPRIHQSEVDAVVVTRGDVDLRPVLRSLRAFRHTIIWDNKERPNLRVFGRFAAACLETASRVVYVQDDDCVVRDQARILAAWEPGLIAANMPDPHRRRYDGTGMALLGFGSAFEPSLAVSAFSRYLSRWPMDELFLRECDRVFTALNKIKLVDAEFEHLPWADDGSRMLWEEAHEADLHQIAKRIRELRRGPTTCRAACRSSSARSIRPAAVAARGAA